MFGAKKKQVRRVAIHPVTGEILSGPHRGKSIGARLGRHLRALPSTVPGEAVVYDVRHWSVVEDRYNFNPPRSADGSRIRPAFPIVLGWLVPTT